MAHTVIGLLGHIAIGKTETSKYLEKNKEQLYRFAPHDLPDEQKVIHISEFVDPEAVRLFYLDPRKYADNFEEILIHSRDIRHILAKASPGIVILERTIFEGFHVFIENSKESGFLTPEGYGQCYDILRRSVQKLKPEEQKQWKESLLVYHRVRDLDILIERQRKRSRLGETISWGYNFAIQQKYEQFCTSSALQQNYGHWGLTPPDILEIDACVDFNNDVQYHQRILEQIVSWLEVNKYENKR